MLFHLYPTITQNYYILCFIVCLGALQWSAARNRILGLSLLGPWGLGRPGIIAGLVLIMGGFNWFFIYTPGLFSSGLAGGELSSLFAGGALNALVAARLSGVLWQRVHKFNPP